MLFKFNSLSKSWIFKIIVALIVLSFGLVGLQNFLINNERDINQNNNLTVVEVDGKKVSIAKFRNELNKLASNFIAQGIDISENQQILKILQQRALDNAINNQLVLNIANKLDLDININYILTKLKSSPFFADQNGSFSVTKFQNYLTNSQLSENEFLNNYRDGLKVDLIGDIVGGLNFSAIKPADYFYAFRNQLRNVEIIKIKQNEVAKNIKVSNLEVKEFYNKNKNNFFEPEKLKIKYVILNKNDLKINNKPSEEELKLTYENDKLKAINSAKVGLLQIFVDLTKHNDIKKYLTEINNALANVKTKEDFKKIAIKYTDDDFSKKNGGLLETSINNLPVFLQKPAKELQVNSFNKEPIESDYGYHYLYIFNRGNGGLGTFVEEKPKLINKLIEEQKTKKFTKVKEDLANEAYVSKDLNEIANKFNLIIKETEFFEPTNLSGLNEKFVTNSQFYTQLQKEDITDNGFNSEVIELNDNQAMIFRVTDKKAKRNLTLAEARSTIKKNLSEQKTKQLIEQKIPDYIKDLVANNSNTRIVKEIKKDLKINTNWIEFDELSFDDDRINSQIIRAIFQLPRVQEEGIRRFGYLPNAVEGEYYIMAIKKVIEGDFSSLNSAERDGFINAYAIRKGYAMLDYYISKKKQAADIQINPDLQAVDN